MRCTQCETLNEDDATACYLCGEILVDPDADPGPVPLEAGGAVEYVDFSVRFVAWTFDIALFLVIGFFMLYLEQPELEILTFILFVFYQLVSTALWGQTLGKMFVGIRVVRPGQALPGWGTAFQREVIGKIISAVPFGWGFLWINRDRWGQGYHDKVAGTYVVRLSSPPSGLRL